MQKFFFVNKNLPKIEIKIWKYKKQVIFLVKIAAKNIEGYFLKITFILYG
jgi:hypothetical protein